jgi:ABC-type oligopeptide transport system substrate-binding subunit
MRPRSRVVTLAISALAAGGLALVPAVITAAPAAAASGSFTLVNIAYAFEHLNPQSTNSATACQTVNSVPVCQTAP